MKRKLRHGFDSNSIGLSNLTNVNMEQNSGFISGDWIWGSIWVFYSLFYAIYFGHVAYRLKPDLAMVNVPGSPERLRHKQRLCYRFALFMVFPTVLEMIQSSRFTSLIITVLPCVFGLWVMHAVWRDVLNSKIPKEPRGGKASDSGR